MEIFFTMVRSNPNIEGLEIMGFQYLLSAYADDATFILKNTNSVKEIFKTFDTFSEFSGLKANRAKCEIAGIGVKNGAEIALLDLKCINLNNDSIRILGVHFSYNSEIFEERNFQEIVNLIESVLATWRWRNLTLLGKISVFKSLAFSKIIFISYLSNVQNSILSQIEKLQKEFIWSGKNPKIKHSTLIADYEQGGLKDIDVKAKIKSLQLSWVRRLYSQNFHPWKNIPLKLIESTFHQNIFFPNAKITPPSIMPQFYKQIFSSWGILSQDPITPVSILNQSVWYNSFIQIDNTPIKKLFPFELFIFNLYEDGVLVPWNSFKNKYDLQPNNFFKWRQIISAIPMRWKACITGNPHEHVLTPPVQHILDLTRPIPLEKLTSKYLYMLFIRKISKPPTSQTLIENAIGDSNINWPSVYSSGRKTTIDTYGRMFHYKCSQNILFLNKALFRMRISNTTLCSYCKSADETILHLFFECNKIKTLWNELINAYPHIPLPQLSPRSAFLGPDQVEDTLVNQLHLIFRIVIYRQREAGFCNLLYIKAKIKSISKLEENITYLNPHAKAKNMQKWARINNL